MESLKEQAVPSYAGVKLPCYYFGCKDRPGHFLWGDDGRRSDNSSKNVLPFKFSILDAGFLPEVCSQIEGLGTLVHFPKWTVLSFWDRSVDKRPGCNSAFVLYGHWTFSESLEISKVKFPWVWSRFNFEVRLAH